MNRDQLTQAHRAAALAGSLDEALANPLLAKCLAITAAAIGRTSETKTQTPCVTAPATHHNHRHPAGRDFKRASAGDQDD